MRNLIRLNVEFVSENLYPVVTGDDSGDDSGDEGPEREREDEEDMEEVGSPVSQRLKNFPPPANLYFHQIDERAPSPETVLLKGSQENTGPSPEAEAEFEKELAKMMTETSAESRRVDRRTALALWETATLPTGLKKKRVDDFEEDGDTPASAEESVMNFTLITRGGRQRQVGSPLFPKCCCHSFQNHLDSSNRRPFRVRIGHPDTYSPNPGQGGTTTIETAGVEL